MDYLLLLEKLLYRCNNKRKKRSLNWKMDICMLVYEVIRIKMVSLVKSIAVERPL